MKLTELIGYFRNGGTFKDFCTLNDLDTEAEVIEIYARDPVSLDATLGFFSIEETKGRTRFESGEVSYQNLFDFYYFLDVVEEAKKREHLNDDELARTLLSYALNDA